MNLTPLTIELTADTRAFHEALHQAKVAMATFGEVWLFFPRRLERPVDRASRLRMERWRRARTRREIRRCRRAQAVTA